MVDSLSPPRRIPLAAADTDERPYNTRVGGRRVGSGGAGRVPVRVEREAVARRRGLYIYGRPAFIVLSSSYARCRFSSRCHSYVLFTIFFFLRSYILLLVVEYNKFSSFRVVHIDDDEPSIYE